MQIFYLEKDLPVVGVEVKNFPEGIGPAFDELVNKISGEIDRAYFGISYMEKNKFIYIAAAIEKRKGEAEKYHCARYHIQKGNYLVVGLKDWRNNIDLIKGIFYCMMQNENADTTKPCVEWYKNDEEMWCMIQAKSNH